MTTAMAERLREEDLAPGRPWVHPDTKLEYADFAAYLVHRDPLPHWRNARIKETRSEEGQKRWQRRCETISRYPDAFDAQYRTLDEYVEGECARLTRYYDRDGNPFAAARTDEHGLAHNYA